MPPFASRRLCVWFAVILFAAGCGSNDSNPVQTAADAFVSAGVPGVVVMIAGPEGSEVFVAGHADIENDVALEAGHRFPIGGLTTTYVSTVMLELDQEGVLPLGDAVEDYLPGRFSYGWDIALYDLLQHTSGIPDYVTVGEGEGLVIESCLASDRCSWTSDELTGLVDQSPPDFGPGEGWGYSNTNYVIAGEIVEQVTGLRWDDQVTDRILKPLGLTETVFVDPEAGPGSDALATGYHAVDADGALAPVDKIVPGGSGPEGGIISTVGDVMAFFRPLLRGDVLTDAGNIALTATAPTSFGHEDYGLGVSFTFGFGSPQVGNTGEAYGYSSFVEHNRDTDVTTVILVNQSGGFPTAEWGDLLSAATALPGREVQARAADSGPGQLRLYCTLDPELFN